MKKSIKKFIGGALLSIFAISFSSCLAVPPGVLSVYNRFPAPRNHRAGVITRAEKAAIYNWKTRLYNSINRAFQSEQEKAYCLYELYCMRKGQNPLPNNQVINILQGGIALHAPDQDNYTGYLCAAVLIPSRSDRPLEFII